MFTVMCESSGRVLYGVNWRQISRRGAKYGVFLAVARCEGGFGRVEAVWAGFA
jgi:hypothetical protein